MINNNEKIESQREILNVVIKDIIKRIKQLQKDLVLQKEDCRCFGHYEDCGSFYQEQVSNTEAIIEELIRQKINFERKRKHLKDQIKN